VRLRYYMDVHVPAAITEGLRRRGVDVVTSQEDGTRDHSDESLLDRSASLQRVLVTQDEDFLALASIWQANRRDFPGLIFMPQLAAGIGRYVEDLELIAACCSPAEVAGLVTHLPLP
jgi:hypothetical protein